MKTLTLALTLALIAGCGTSAQIAKLEDDVATLRRNDIYQKKYIASLETSVRSTAAPSPAEPAKEPSPPPAAPVPEVGYAAALVYPQPVGYQCFVADMPGTTPSGWVMVGNGDLDDDRKNEAYLSMTVDGLPLIVMQPVGGRWEPLLPGRRDITVLPPGRSCYFRPPARLAGGRLRKYQLGGHTYVQAVASTPQHIVLEPNPWATIRPITFSLYPRGTTPVMIRHYRLH